MATVTDSLARRLISPEPCMAAAAAAAVRSLAMRLPEPLTAAWRRPVEPVTRAEPEPLMATARESPKAPLRVASPEPLTAKARRDGAVMTARMGCGAGSTRRAGSRATR